MTEDYELKKKMVDDDRKEIDQKMRQRDLLNKDVVTAEEEERKKDEPKGLARIKKEDVPDTPKILASCVSLGSKMLFEQRIRRAVTVSTLV